MKDHGVAVSDDLLAKHKGTSEIFVARGGQLLGAIAVADTIRPEARRAIDTIHRMGIKTILLTGDVKAVADVVAKQLGIGEVAADLMPEDKLNHVKRLVANGRIVAMLGDGVNDAPALTQANVGFAIGAGTDVAMDSADVVLMKSDPYDIVGAVELSRATLRKMHQNLWWAVGYNVIAFPIAAGVLYPFMLSPEVAAFAMSGSTLIVAINALMLKRTKLAGLGRPGKNAPTAVPAVSTAS